MTQIVSKQRVSDHGEVFTNEREVNAMLDLVKQETERIDSRFLEPACGTGNFLEKILERKLAVVERRYGKLQFDYERNAVLAVCSIYGIDILEDNLVQCRERLFNLFNSQYIRLFGDNCKEDCRASIRIILGLNIIHGDAITLKKVNKDEPIVFSEWSQINSNYLKRRDFSFQDLLEHEIVAGLPLFSDLGQDVFIPKPIKDYPVQHFLELSNE
ncbi:SAM-dependent DNA methyltransferase [Paenalcaligenes hermetiae]|uniref:Type III restriction endonuclease subunit M n=1 Tax=Paenalcaligenes hermetiae TaxID=1157987 RepID=A0ABP9MAJ9_9BURK